MFYNIDFLLDDFFDKYYKYQYNLNRRINHYKYV